MYRAHPLHRCPRARTGRSRQEHRDGMSRGGLNTPTMVTSPQCPAQNTHERTHLAKTILGGRGHSTCIRQSCHTDHDQHHLCATAHYARIPKKSKSRNPVASGFTTKNEPVSMTERTIGSTRGPKSSKACGITNPLSGRTNQTAQQNQAHVRRAR